MDLDRNRRHALYSWLFVALVAVLCITLGALQFRWLGEVSAAERDRLRAGLQSSLARFGQHFNDEISAAAAALSPSAAEDPESPGEARPAAILARWEQWKDSGRHPGLLLRGALLRRQDDKLEVRMAFPASAAVPDAWEKLKTRWEEQRIRDQDMPGPRRAPGGLTAGEPSLFEAPLFQPPRPDRGRPPLSPRGESRDRGFTEEWLLLELDLDYVRANLIPELLQRHLGGGADYRAEIVTRDEPPALIFSSESNQAPSIGRAADATAAFFELQLESFFRRGGGRRGGGPPRFGFGDRGRPGGPPDRGRWLLNVQHRAGSLEAVVDRVRVRNLAVSGGILLLMVAAVASLVRFTRRAQHLASLEMEFVAGVSHELRTPLSVIRTAAHNLGRGVVRDPAQVQRYGSLIRDEAERLGLIVEQVLKFSAAKAGQVIGERERIPLGPWLAEIVQHNEPAASQAGCTLELDVASTLPPVSIDTVAMRQALQNLIGNALKYGAAGGWIGVVARASADNLWVELAVTDRGPGIAADELKQIFDPFYRGKRAVGDQIHGTGLGLSLVRRIVEAHGGSVAADSRPGEGARFTIRIPAAPPEIPPEAPLEKNDEFSNPAG